MRVDTLQVRAAAPRTTPTHDPAAATASSPSAGSSPSEQSLVAVQAAAQRIQEYLREARCELSFAVDSESGRVVITVTDANTGEKLRQIPSEEVLRIARYLTCSAARLVDTRA